MVAPCTLYASILITASTLLTSAVTFDLVEVENPKCVVSVSANSVASLRKIEHVSQCPAAIIFDPRVDNRRVAVGTCYETDRNEPHSNLN